jgi:hypothetical protein
VEKAAATLLAASEFCPGLRPAERLGVTVSKPIAVDRDFLIELAGRIRGQVIRDVEHGLRGVLGR